MSGVLLVGIAIGLGLGLGLHASELPKGQKPTVESHPLHAGDDEVLPPSNTELGNFTHFAVSSDGVPCAQIASDILKRNGTAADAAIAGLFCVGVVNPQSMGLGGGFLLTYYSKKEGKGYSLNAREMAPQMASTRMFTNAPPKTSLKGGLAVGVPGEARGYYELYKRFGGGLEWRELLEPAIKLCEGHQVHWHMSKVLTSSKQYITKENGFEDFIDAEGNLLKTGDTFKRPKLAQTLRKLQDNPDALNTGPLAKSLVGDIKKHGGIITESDLELYEPVWRQAIDVSLKNGEYRMFSIPPPGGGLVVAYILNILDEFGLSPADLEGPNEASTYHLIIEAMKYAYARRTELGDASFVDMTKHIANLTSDFYAKETAQKLDRNKTYNSTEHYGVFLSVPEDHGTAHFSLLAPDGDAVAVTSTVNLGFGAGFISTSTGLVLNDQMDDFSSPGFSNFFGIPPSEANFIEPGKRPLSSMSPSIFVDKNGDVSLIAGASGGTKIISAVAQVAIRNLWFKEDIKEAIDARRLHHQLFPMAVQYEEGTSKRIVEELELYGHATKQYKLGRSVVCGIAQTSKVSNGVKSYDIFANADFRKPGEVSGT